VILPAIPLGLLVVLCLNLFGAWMLVLVAEATSVGHGLGPIMSVARNTFHPELVYRANATRRCLLRKLWSERSAGQSAMNGDRHHRGVAESRSGTEQPRSD
jgi:hypothetical protein